MKKRRARQTIEQWTEIVTDYNPAMETMADFCTRRDLALSTFQRWHSRIVNPASHTEDAFTEVKSRGRNPIPTTSELTLHMGLDITLTIRTGQQR